MEIASEKKSSTRQRVGVFVINKKNILENTLKKASHFKMRILNMKKARTEDDDDGKGR